jgi:hypothetical protein
VDGSIHDRTSQLARAIAAGKVTPISIGPQCVPAFVLKKLGLRKAAYPFDWLVSSLAMAEYCVEDDFRMLLDPEQLEEPSVMRTAHRYFSQRFGLHPVFNHHRMPDQLAHFQRAVERFRTAPNPVYLYMDRGPPDEAVAARLRERLPGPLLIYTIAATKGPVRFQDCGWFTAFRSHDKMIDVGFRSPADWTVFRDHFHDILEQRLRVA